MKEKDRKCSKCGCSAQDPSITLHRFPMPGRTNSLKCELWAKYCFPKESWTSPKFQYSLYSRHLMLCTKHFKRSSFMDSFGKRLVKSAVPEEPESLEQTETSEPMSSFSEDCLNNDDVDLAATTPLLCICCLERVSPYINLSTCTHVDFLDSFVKPEMKPNEQVICYQCHNMLKKIKLFKLQVENSFKLLSESVESISQDAQQKLNLEKCQIFNIDIPSTWRNRNRRTKNRGNLKTKRPKTKTAIDKIEDVPKTNTAKEQIMSEPPKTNAENNILPNSAKKNKNIEDALKIININQNSGCINLLATSLQTISCTLLGSIYRTNSEIGNQISAPTDFLFSINTPKTTNAAHNSSANISTVLNNTNLEIGNQISAPTDIFPNINTSTTTNAAHNSSANIINEIKNTNFEIGNQISARTDIFPNINTSTTTNAAHNSRETIVTELNNTNFEINSKISTPTDIFSNINIPTTPNAAHNSSANIINEIKNTKFVIGNEISAPTNILYSILNNTPENKTATSTFIYNTREDNNTNLEIANHTASNDILFGIGTSPIRNFTAVSSENITHDNTTENNVSLIDDDVNIIQNEDPDVVETVADEELLPLAEDKSNDGSRSNMQTNEPVIYKPCLGSNIRQLTLTRDQLMDERAKMSSSLVFLRSPHRCESCLIGFQFRENLDDHVKRKHTAELMRNPEQCDVCLQFLESDNYEKHLFLHLTRYECVTCSQQFTSYEKAVLHYKKQHRVNKPKTMLKCPQCLFKTEHVLKLKRHVRRVTKCKACGDSITHGCGTGMTYNRHVAQSLSILDCLEEIAECVWRSYANCAVKGHDHENRNELHQDEQQHPDHFKIMQQIYMKEAAVGKL